MNSSLAITELSRILEFEVMPAQRLGKGRIAPCDECLDSENRAYMEAYPYANHRHQHFQGFWLLSGTAHMRLEDRNYLLEPGDFCLIPPGMRHADIYTDETPAYRALWFHAFAGTLHPYLFVYEPVGKWSVPLSNFVVASSEIGRLLTALQAEMESNAVLSRDVKHGILLQLAGWLARIEQTVDAVSMHPPPGYLVRRVVQHLEHHYDREITLNEVARVACLSPNYLASIFKKETGQTVFEALTDIRVRHARRLLLDEASSVQNVARAVGYNDVSHFCSVFRRRTGISPGRYGKRSAGESDVSWNS